MPISPGDVEDLVHEVRRLYDDAEVSLLERLAAALAADIGSPRWAELKLAAVGDLRAAVETVTDALQTDADGAVRRAVAEAYARGRQAAVADVGALDSGREGFARNLLPNAPAVDRLAADFTTTNRPLYLRITRSVMDAYQRITGRTSGGVLLGTVTRRQASQRALDQLASRGITGFVSVDGRSWDMASYAEMAVRSITARAAVDSHVDSLVDLGQRLVMVSDAPLECPLCAPWEGEVLAINGRSGPHALRVEHAIQPTGLRAAFRPPATVVVHVAGSLPEARAAGLFHPNCRHSISLYQPGVSTRPVQHPTPGTTYADTQRQREIERHIREWKRRASVALDDDARRRANTYVRRWQAAQREHVAAHEFLTRKPAREQIGQAR
ncbi:phage minor capsid protein [Streptomyces subrutilus]|uniref:phage minor capsid protein n=1 Tax=Streptomyces subrutilus TaxID=36818 RepID=UPI002E0D4ADD|nr:phage minor capsid protein [Streptomyces subrutilus]